MLKESFEYLTTQVFMTDFFDDEDVFKEVQKMAHRGMVQTLKCVDDEHERLSLCDDHFKRICASDLPCVVAYDLKRQDDPKLVDAQNPEAWPTILKALAQWTAGKPALEMAVDQSVRVPSSLIPLMT